MRSRRTDVLRGDDSADMQITCSKTFPALTTPYLLTEIMTAVSTHYYLCFTRVTALLLVYFNKVFRLQFTVNEVKPN